MLVIGSKALATYIKDIGRISHDWDIWMSDADYDKFLLSETGFNHIKSTPFCHLYEKNGEIIEIKTESQFCPTDHMVFDSMNMEWGIMTPVGPARIPTIQVLYDVKKSTALCIDEPKHQYDVDLIEKTFPDLKQDTELFKLRLEETRTRVENSKKVKYDFFHKYHIPEYIYHDNLHVIIADLIGLAIPTYQRITTADTDIGEELFNKLTHEQKISLMVEESLVLALERWFIPNMIENGINIRLVDMFYNNNEGLPTYQILKHCCITGLKGEAEYITGFARANFFEIEKEWQAAKATIKAKKGFPPHFYNELFSLRDRYKKGEKIALT